MTHLDKYDIFIIGRLNYGGMCSAVALAGCLRRAFDELGTTVTRRWVSRRLQRLKRCGFVQATGFCWVATPRNRQVRTTDIFLDVFGGVK